MVGVSDIIKFSLKEALPLISSRNEAITLCKVRILANKLDSHLKAFSALRKHHHMIGTLNYTLLSQLSNINVILNSKSWHLLYLKPILSSLESKACSGETTLEREIDTMLQELMKLKSSIDQFSKQNLSISSQLNDAGVHALSSNKKKLGEIEHFICERIDIIISISSGSSGTSIMTETEKSSSSGSSSSNSSSKKKKKKNIGGISDTVEKLLENIFTQSSHNSVDNVKDGIYLNALETPTNNLPAKQIDSTFFIPPNDYIETQRRFPSLSHISHVSHMSVPTHSGLEFTRDDSASVEKGNSKSPSKERYDTSSISDWKKNNAGDRFTLNDGRGVNINLNLSNVDLSVSGGSPPDPLILTSFELSGPTSVKNKEGRRSADGNGVYNSKNSSYELSDTGAVKGSAVSTQESSEIRLLQEQMQLSQQQQQEEEEEKGNSSNEKTEEDYGNYLSNSSGDTGHTSQLEGNNKHFSKRKFVEMEKDGTGSAGTLHDSINSDENMPTQNSQN